MRNSFALLWHYVKELSVFLLIAVLIELQYVAFAQRAALQSVDARLSETYAALATLTASTTEERAYFEDRIVQLSDGVYNEQKRGDDLAEKIDDMRGNVHDLSGSVKTLEKLTTTDPELLQKYSRIYFLNENYIPADLAPIEEKFDFKNGKEVTVHAEMLPFLEDMLANAWDDGVDLQVLSGYRSFAEQTTLKQDYTTRYGTGANSFSADQGYSEHQLGTAVDLTDETIGENLNAFESSPDFTWLEKNAYKYGFILSYPKGNTYYVYEPWHWRFVGKDLARYLYRNHKYFYDMEQRDIDAYLADIFD